MSIHKIRPGHFGHSSPNVAAYFDVRQVWARAPTGQPLPGRHECREGDGLLTFGTFW